MYKKWYQENKETLLKDLFTFLKFPSISADPNHRKDIEACAEWVRDYLNQSGLKAEIWPTKGAPSVFGHIHVSDDAPTLLFYTHFDVQPVDPLELWDSPPFEPEIREGHFYARGAQDNKGQCFYTLAALRAYLALSKEKKLNLKILVEGEEESDGEGTLEFIARKKKELKSDYLLIVDLGMKEKGVPAVTLGLRGMLSMELVITNGAHDFHSGAHGGMVLNPLRALTTLLAKMWDANGKVAVPHFYDGVAPVKNLEKIDLSFEEEHYKNEFSISVLAPEGGFTPIESNQVRPTLEINGIAGGYAGVGFKSVIPCQATAKISCRLVCNQDPEKVFAAIKSYCEQNLPKGLSFQLRYLGGSRAFLTSVDAKLAKVAKEAYEAVFQKEAKFILCGGSVPIVPTLQEASGAETALIGLGLDSDQIHAPNEHFGLDRLEQGFLSITEILGRL